MPTHVCSLSFSPEARRLETCHRVVSATGSAFAPQLSTPEETSAQPFRETSAGPAEVKDAGLATVGSDDDSGSVRRLVVETKDPGCSFDTEGTSRLKEGKDGVLDERRVFDASSFTKREGQGISAISCEGSASARRPRRVAIPKGAFKTVSAHCAGQATTHGTTLDEQALPSCRGESVSCSDVVAKSEPDSRRPRSELTLRCFIVKSFTRKTSLA